MWIFLHGRIEKYCAAKLINVNGGNREISYQFALFRRPIFPPGLFGKRVKLLIKKMYKNSDVGRDVENACFQLTVRLVIA